MSRLPAASGHALLDRVNLSNLGSELVCFSHHINVDIGDSAIHLWVRLTDVGGTITKVVEHAVLIDGGTRSQGLGIRAIHETITAIERDYVMFDHSGILKFDSVVITHWDEDHWGGLRDFLWLDYVNQIKTFLSTTNRGDGQHYLNNTGGGSFSTQLASPITSLRPEMNLRCSRFKYRNGFNPTSADAIVPSRFRKFFRE